MTNSVLARLAVIISANSAEFNRALKDTRKDLSGFMSSVKGVAGTLGVAFGTRELLSFGLEISKLAGQAEGVKTAFDRLPNSVKVMSELKAATGGTVSELELMKRAVQASNFDISLEALPKLLEFATLRAQQTGQSVDYLVDSIVTGIGRKSKLILDNLGISATQLNQKLKGTSTEAATVGDVARAVGEIAEESLKNMAGFAENASTKVQRLGASWDNLKVAMGNAANNSGLLNRFLTITTKQFNELAGDEIATGMNQLKASLGTNAEILERFAAAGGKIDLSWQELMAKGFFRNEEAAKKYEKILADISKRVTEVNNKAGQDIDPLTGMPSGGLKPFNGVPETEKQIQTLEKLKEAQKKLQETFHQTDINDTKELNNIANKIIANQKLIDKYEAMLKAIDKVNLKQAIKWKGPDVSPSTENPFASNDLDFNGEDDSDQRFREDMEGLLGLKKAYDELNVSVYEHIQAQQKVAEERDAMIEGMYRQMETVAMIGEAIGQSFVDAANGQQTYLEALKNVTGQIIEMYLKQAIAAMIAAAIKDPSQPLPVGKLAMAAFGIGAVKALFGQIGGAGGGGGSSRGAAPGISMDEYGNRTRQVDVSVAGEISGYAISLNQTKEKYRRGVVG
jgi:DNA-binding transcriptional regulator YdaS (Cro superfamily)